MALDFIERAVPWRKGRLFGDFVEGQVFQHHWGRTITESDTITFSTVMLCFNPLYFNRPYARRHGHPDIVVNPQLVFNVALGLSVQDLSEIGGPFLGVSAVTYHRPVYPGETLFARSVTVSLRESRSDPSNGIVTWHTEGLDENGDRLVDFTRSNLVGKRSPFGDA